MTRTVAPTTYVSAAARALAETADWDDWDDDEYDPAEDYAPVITAVPMARYL